MNESKRAPNNLIWIMLLLLLVGLILQGIMVSTLYVARNPESRLLDVARQVDDLETSVDGLLLPIKGQPERVVRRKEGRTMFGTGRLHGVAGLYDPGTISAKHHFHL